MNSVLLSLCLNMFAVANCETIIRSFKKCGISITRDGTDDTLFEVSDSSSSNDNEDFSGFRHEHSSGYRDNKRVSPFSYYIFVYVQVFSANVTCCLVAFTNMFKYTKHFF